MMEFSGTLNSNNALATDRSRNLHHITRSARYGKRHRSSRHGREDAILLLAMRSQSDFGADLVIARKMAC